MTKTWDGGKVDALASVVFEFDHRASKRRRQAQRATKSGVAMVPVIFEQGHNRRQQPTKLGLPKVGLDTERERAAWNRVQGGPIGECCL